MTPISALRQLFSMARKYGDGRNESAARLYFQILIKALGTESRSAVDEQQLKTLQSELADRTIRIAELEEKLAAAKKPKRRTTRKKKNDATTNAPESVEKSTS